jgi:hypothetical protein
MVKIASHLSTLNPESDRVEALSSIGTRLNAMSKTNLAEAHGTGAFHTIATTAALAAATSGMPANTKAEDCAKNGDCTKSGADPMKSSIFCGGGGVGSAATSGSTSDAAAPSTNDDTVKIFEEAWIDTWNPILTGTGTTSVDSKAISGSIIMRNKLLASTIRRLIDGDEKIWHETVTALENGSATIAVLPVLHHWIGMTWPDILSIRDADTKRSQSNQKDNRSQQQQTEEAEIITHFGKSLDAFGKWWGVFKSESEAMTDDPDLVWSTKLASDLFGSSPSELMGYASTFRIIDRTNPGFDRVMAVVNGLMAL